MSMPGDAPARDPHLLKLRLSGKRLPRAVRRVLLAGLHRMLGFEAFNAIYRALPPGDPLAFGQDFLDSLQIRLQPEPAIAAVAPATGPLLVVANHPYGMIEGLAIDALFTPLRSDGALMALYWLGAIPEYAGRVILVGRQGRRPKRAVSHRGWREALVWLRGGHALAIFPAGRIARFDLRRRAVAEQPWSPHVAALARRTGAPILPVWFHGHNGWGYQLASLLFPPLQNVALVRQIANKRGMTLRVTIGRLIPPDELARYPTDAAAIAFLRAETERLATSPP